MAFALGITLVTLNLCRGHGVRVLVVANEGARREALTRYVRETEHEVCGTSEATEVSLAVLRDRPGALLVEAESGESATLRRLLGRARATAQEQLPALLLLPPHSLWLRAALPPEVMPALALASDAADGDALGRALGALAPSADAPRPQAAQSELWLDRQQRTLSGPAGAAQLTASEASLLAAILDGDGAVITTERRGRAVVGWVRARPPPPCRHPLSRAHAEAQAARDRDGRRGRNAARRGVPARASR